MAGNRDERLQPCRDHQPVLRRQLTSPTAGDAYWLSSLPSGLPLATLVRLAKLRWRIEHDYREMKQVLGLAHFEGRTWNGWHHHVTLVSTAHAFCTLRRLARDPKDTAQA
ncbi:transposase [Streptomyces sp. NPDC101149]|uniref:transposase n=1 Tax=Streptomyces sp. NPDC101149 TaxID=3366113 RepID=UPI0038145460